MNAITLSRRFAEKDGTAVHDVGECIRSWGMRGVLFGGLFGFAFAAILVAIPHATEVLTFGIIGTLIVGAVECAVVAGAFGAFAAALNGKGALRNDTRMNRLPADANWRQDGIALTAWPERWSYPESSALAQPRTRNES